MSDTSKEGVDRVYWLIHESKAGAIVRSEACAMLRNLAQERDDLRSALEKAASQVSDLAAKLGRAEGKLEASELPGIIDGWKARAEKAEAEVERLRDELRRMEGFDVCTCGPCALHPQRKEGNE